MAGALGVSCVLLDSDQRLDVVARVARDEAVSAILGAYVADIQVGTDLFCASANHSGSSRAGNRGPKC